MDGLEQKFRRLLEKSAAEAGQFRPLEHGRLRRVRILQTLYLVGAAGLVTLMTLGAAWTIASVSGSTPAADVDGPLGPELLYILDSAPGGAPTHEAVLWVRIEEGVATVVGRYSLGDDADIALSPDGTRLYGVSRRRTSAEDIQDTLTIIDTLSESVIEEIALPFRWQGTLGFRTLAKIVVSPDGASVHVLVGFDGHPATSSPSIATFDVATGRMLPAAAALDRCGSPTLLPRVGSRIVVVCGETNEVRFLQLGRSGDTESEHRLTLPWSPSPAEDDHEGIGDTRFVNGAAMSADGKVLYAVSRVGRVSVIDVEAEALVRTVTLDLPAGFHVEVSHLAVAPTGERLVIGIGSRSNWAYVRPTGILTVDTESWIQSENVPTAPFSSIAVAGDGARIFTVDRDTGVLAQVTIDPAEARNAATEDFGKIADLPQVILYAP